MKKVALLMMISVLVAGCATTHAPTSNPQRRAPMESDPPTARIEVSSQYGGPPLVRIDIPQIVTANGELAQPVITVTYPRKAGQAVQERLIAYDDPVPARTFDAVDIEDIPRSSQEMQRRLIAYNGPAPVRTYLVGAPRPSQEIPRRLIAADDPAPVQTFLGSGLNIRPAQQNSLSNQGPTEPELKNALAKARANGDTKFEGEILQYAKGRGMRVEKGYTANSF